MCIIKVSCIFLFSLLFLNSVRAQDPPVVWGEIPKADLEMTSFPDDSNATAIILCDYGESFINNEINIELNHIRRIKILSDKGFDWGTISLIITSEDSRESLFDIEGFTYNLDENNNIVASELDEDDIFEEELDDKHIRYRFTMPNLKPGCIIEYSYKIEAKSIFDIRDWVFQYSEPVRWSEYRVTFPKNVNYASVYSGFEPWAINSTSEVTKVYRGAASVTLGGTIVKCFQFRYAVKDAPAIRNEPFITTTQDYKNQVDVQLSGYVFPGTGVEEVLKTWPALISELLEASYYGEMIDVTGDVEDLSEEITKGLNTPEEKLEAIYNWVSKSITWTESYKYYCENDVDDIIELKKGNSTEKNILFLSLLKSVGIESYPVILSTRANGKVKEIYPLIFQFNHTISKVIIDGKTQFIDTVDPLKPMDILPVNILGVKGLIVKEDAVEWFEFSTKDDIANKTLVIINVDENGVINGNIEDAFNEYKSLSIREDLTSKNETDLIKELYDAESIGYFLDSINIMNKDLLKEPLRIKSSISSDIYAQKNGDLIYINPNLFYRIKENPFKSKVRNFPVDYAYPRSHTILTNITLPDGYELKEKVPNRTLYMGKDLKFSRKIMIHDRFVQVQNIFEIKNTKIKPQDYEKLKNFYTQMISLQNELYIIGLKENQNELGVSR